MSDLEIRSEELHYREDSGEGFLEGIAVPWGQTVTIHNPDGTSYQEAFERGSVQPDGTVWLYDGHKTPIGVVEAAENREDGFFIRAKFALSDLAQSVYEQVKNGALNKLSVGFSAQEHRDDDGVVVRTLTRLREVSVVARPAYSLATILSVREESTDPQVPNTERSTMTDENKDLVEVRSEIEELRQEFAMLPEKLAVRDEKPKVDTRSAAAALLAIAKGDEAVTAAYNAENGRVTDEALTRAYTGGTLADAPLQNQWVGDLTRIFDNSSGVFAETFSRGTLPSKGMTLEYAKLKSATGTVQEQLNEGDDLAYMNLKLETASTTVHTYGGRTQFSFQEIQRSTLPVVQRNLEYMAVQAGVNKRAVLRAEVDRIVAENRAIASNAGVIVGGAALNSMDPAKWLTSILAANKRFKAQGYNVEKLIVTEDVFAHLIGLTTSGDRVLRVAEGNSAGTANVGRLTATLFGIPVEVDDTPSSGAATAQAVFVNGAAIRQYDSALVSLQDDNIVNLTRDVSVYRYGAIADENTSLIVPVKFAAS